MWFAFSLKLEISLLPINKDRINGLYTSLKWITKFLL